MKIKKLLSRAAIITGSAAALGTVLFIGSAVLASGLKNAGLFRTKYDVIKPSLTYANHNFADKTFEQNNDNEIVIAVTWTIGKDQYATLEKLIEVFNDKFKDNKYYVPVKIKNIGSGYGAGSQKVKLDLQARNNGSFVNAIFNYSPVASDLASYGMLLDLSDERPELSTGTDQFSSIVLNGDKTTSNIINKGTWMLPLVKSTIMQSVSAPVLGYLLQKMRENGAVIDPSFEAEYQHIVELSLPDRDFIKEKWGDVIPGTDFAGLNISKDTFLIFNDLIDFAIEAKTKFTKAKENDELAILGIDGISGFIQSISYASVDGNDSERFTNIQKIINKSTGELYNRIVNFNDFENTEKAFNKKLEVIFKKLKLAFQAKAVRIPEGGDYNSNYQKDHRSVLTYGSTAGYAFNFDNKKTKKSVFFGNTKLETSDKCLDFTLKAQDNHISFKRSNSKLEDKIYKFGYTGRATPFDFIAQSQEAYSLFEKLTAETEQNINRGLTFIKKTQYETLKNQLEQKLTIKNIGEFKRNNDIYVALLLDNRISDIILNFDGSEKDLEAWKKSMSQEELLIWETPSKWLKSDQKKVYFAQGPNFIGIHANSREDDGVKLFARFLSSNEKYNISGEIQGRAFNYNAITPSEFLTRQAGYIAPIKGFENIDFQNNDELNPAVKLAAKIYKKAITEPNEYQLFEEFGDPRTESFRGSLDGAFRGSNNASRSGKNIGTYKEEIIDIVVNGNQSIFRK
ncbi:P68 family surface lipoprotein [Mycoplasma phocimorsus]|uniref:P80 family lipoprotein n=1 Tax=Mycoplasma phocimorsus TaxID=3045839 RepID=A0AAJ1PSI1_9MOLU|nr:P80 family lipoprotein [Mycoplasma phocimorsus]MDJ1645963.1 P80 family lipoprotein [Mycoplasma phocimorsus]MDJ1646249.1 P80 family lipoprotein [Mycoplasma phocimorsus]MDJ1647820.1 P80 family lipoprotein [Mycoplasma phocimorsus]